MVLCRTAALLLLALAMTLLRTRPAVSIFVVALVAALPAQSTGRSLRQLAPPVVGSSATFEFAYPAGAVGNGYALLWCMPQFPGTWPLPVPGLTLHGALRLDPSNTLLTATGLLDGSGSVAFSLAVPNNPGLAGFAWDLQTADFSLGSSEVHLSDNDLALAVALSPQPSLNMVSIPPGTFWMGSNAAPGTPYFPQPWEGPLHQVTISRQFWIGKYEVTQTEYQAVMGGNPSYHQGASWPNSATRPVEMVTWTQAMAYCAALTVQQAALGRLPSGYVYRLPSEAEWEYCCRAGTTTEFHTGPSLTCTQANFNYSTHTSTFCTAGNGWTRLVGSYAANAWGLHDMHGNVAEWCLDHWDGSANYPNTAVTDPYVGNTGALRVLRGGSWSNNSYGCRSALRNYGVPSFLDDYVGFRVVLAPVLP